MPHLKRLYTHPFLQKKTLLRQMHTSVGQMHTSKFGQMQNLPKSIGTNAELTKIHSDKCRTYKNPFGQMRNLQKSIQTNAEHTKIHSDKRQLYNSSKRQLNNSDKCSFPLVTIKNIVSVIIAGSPAKISAPGSPQTIISELIEETARRRKVIFDMWESFGYGSTKF